MPREDLDLKSSNAALLLCCQLVDKFIVRRWETKREFTTAEKPVFIFCLDSRRGKSKGSKIALWV